MADLITLAEYARTRGVSRSAVTQAVKRYEIPRHGEHGLIDRAEANELWNAHADQALVMDRADRRARKAAEKATEPKPEPPKRNGRRLGKPVAPTSAVKPASAEPPRKPSRGTLAKAVAISDSSPATHHLIAFQEARSENEVLKAKMAHLDYERKRGELVDVQAARDAVFESFRRFRDNWQQWPARVYADMASELGIDPEIMRRALEERIDAELHRVADPAFHL